MKYICLEYGSGPYLYDGKQVTVIGFDDKEDMNRWLTAGSSREKISTKKYVTDGDGKNVHVRRAAITIDSFYKSAQRESKILVPEMEDMNDTRPLRRSKR